MNWLNKAGLSLLVLYSIIGAAYSFDTIIYYIYGWMPYRLISILVGVIISLFLLVCATVE